jgi:hypothetical protein
MPWWTCRERDRIILGMCQKPLLAPTMKSEAIKNELLSKTERIRKFLRCFWQYVLAYHALHTELQQQQHKANEQCESCWITPVEIVSFVKKFKIHQCALDFDKRFYQNCDNNNQRIFFIRIIIVVVINVIVFAADSEYALLFVRPS